MLAFFTEPKPAHDLPDLAAPSASTTYFSFWGQQAREEAYSPSQGKAPQVFNSRTFVLSCLLTITKDHEKFVIQAAKLHVYQGELMVRRKLILPLTSSHAWRAGGWFSRWKDVWFAPSLPSMGLVMWDQKRALWKQRSWFMLSLQICGGERKVSSLSDSPWHALQLGLYFYGLTPAKLTLEELYFQLLLYYQWSQQSQRYLNDV